MYFNRDKTDPCKFTPKQVLLGLSLTTAPISTAHVRGSDQPAEVYWLPFPGIADYCGDESRLGTDMG